MRTRVKICGITRPEDGRAAIELGADALGLVFCERSPRNVELPQAAEIIDALPPLVTVVALFMNAEAAEVERVLAALPIDLLQFHGDEAPDYCAAFGRRYIKALPMGGDAEPLAYAARYPHTAGFLLDSHSPGGSGGSGTAFDWQRTPERLAKPLIVAGGLHPGNVAQAIVQARPYAVDVSSGVEAGKGIKDPAKMAAFINEVKRVGQH